MTHTPYRPGKGHCYICSYLLRIGILFGLVGPYGKWSGVSDGWTSSLGDDGHERRLNSYIKFNLTKNHTSPFSSSVCEYQNLNI